MNKADTEEKLKAECARRLRDARVAAKYKTAKAFALAVGYAEKNVGTYVHHENGQRAFDRADARRYARKLKVSWAYLLGMKDDDGTQLTEVEVMGEAALTQWIDKSLDKERNKNKLPPIPNPRGAAVRFAVFVKDQSVDRVIGEGEYAVCIPMDDDDELEEGQLVYVEHTKGGLVQNTIRRVTSRPRGGYQLKTHSKLALFESSLDYPNDKREETVVIVGRVIGRYGDIDLV